MPRRQFTPEQIEELRKKAAQWGKIIARQAFGDAGPGLDVDFAAMEQVAEAAAQGLTQGTLETCLEKQAQMLGPQQPCPACGRDCTLDRQTRPLAVRGGRLEQSEPVAYCPDCRRGFFPPTAGVAAGRPRL
jgi:hypothetical protein